MSAGSTRGDGVAMRERSLPRISRISSIDGQGLNAGDVSASSHFAATTGDDCGGGGDATLSGDGGGRDRLPKLSNDGGEAADAESDENGDEWVASGGAERLGCARP